MSLKAMSGVIKKWKLNKKNSCVMDASNALIHIRISFHYLNQKRQFCLCFAFTLCKCETLWLTFRPPLFSNKYEPHQTLPPHQIFSFSCCSFQLTLKFSLPISHLFCQKQSLHSSSVFYSASKQSFLSFSDLLYKWKLWKTERGPRRNRWREFLHQEVRLRLGFSKNWWREWRLQHQLLQRNQAAVEGRHRFRSNQAPILQRGSQIPHPDDRVAHLCYSQE